MTTQEIPVPLKRFAEAYGLEVKQEGRFATRRRNKKWNAAYKEAQEDKLSQNAIELLDVFNVFMSATDNISPFRARAYSRVAQIIRRLDEETITLWRKALVREFKTVKDATGTELESNWKKCYFFQKFVKECSLHGMSEYWTPEGRREPLHNLIRLSGPKNKYSDKPLVFDRDNLEILAPHYSVYDEMSGNEIAEAEGILKLHAAWKTTNDDEKQKIKRFVAVHVNNMDTAVTIIESRFVNTLEELDSLMYQTGDAHALSQGAL